MRTLILLPLLMLAACDPGAKAPSGNVASPTGRVLDAGESVAAPVVLTTADGTKVYGSYSRVGRARALIVLFHQAGSSKDEYATIQPRLAKLGFSSLAIDARAGGEMFGPNETIAKLGHDGSYGEAKQDLEAALNFAMNEGPPVIIWGSSYSAAWALVLASEHRGQVAGVMAFSPGEYLQADKVGEAAALVDVPVFIAAAPDADEMAAAKAIAGAVPKGATLFVPKAGGVHGSSTLIEAKDPDGAAEGWAAVEAWLKQFGPKAG